MSTLCNESRSHRRCRWISSITPRFNQIENWIGLHPSICRSCLVLKAIHSPRSAHHSLVHKRRKNGFPLSAPLAPLHFSEDRQRRFYTADKWSLQTGFAGPEQCLHLLRISIVPWNPRPWSVVPTFFLAPIMSCSERPLWVAHMMRTARHQRHWGQGWRGGWERRRKETTGPRTEGGLNTSKDRWTSTRTLLTEITSFYVMYPDLSPHSCFLREMHKSGTLGFKNFGTEYLFMATGLEYCSPNMVGVLVVFAVPQTPFH